MIDKKALLNRTHNRCAHCGKTLGLETATIEHIFPKSKGGKDDSFNLTVLCEDCNQDKANWVHDICFYRYIDELYRKDYRKCHNTYLYKYRNENILAHEPMQIYFVSDYAEYLLKNSKKKYLSKSLFRNLTTKIEVMQAYPGDATEIYSLIQKCLQNKYFITSESYYDNEMKVLQDIREGCVIVARAKNKIVSVVLMKKAKEFDLEYPQIQNISDMLNLSPGYVVTGYFSEYSYRWGLMDLMLYIEVRMIMMGFLPLYYSDQKTSKKNPQKDLISFPYTFDDFNGLLHTYTFHGIVSLVADEMENTIFKNKDIPRDEVERFVEIWLKDRDELSDEEIKFVSKNKYMKREIESVRHDFREEHSLSNLLN